MGVEKCRFLVENFRQIVEKLEVAVEKILCSVEKSRVGCGFFVEKLWKS